MQNKNKLSGEKTMGGYRPRMLAADDYGTKLLYVNAQGCAAVKVEASIQHRHQSMSPGVNAPEKSS
jgi:hypothetical protein